MRFMSLAVAFLGRSFMLTQRFMMKQARSFHVSAGLGELIVMMMAEIMVFRDLQMTLN
jgi:hypothetical protein